MCSIRTGFIEKGTRYRLSDIKQVSKADTFLWNEKMLCHISAEGFVQSQFMQPEPSFYAHAPLMAATAAMAPEPQYFDHYPGRFFYIKEESTREVFSIPFRPMNTEQDEFSFEPGLSDVTWRAKKFGIGTELKFALPPGEDTVELWKLSVTNHDIITKEISIYAYYPVGFPSWMNTEGAYDEEIGGMLAFSLTPYRKLEDYYRIKKLKDYTYLVSDVKCASWDASLYEFEGWGGLRNPEAIQKEKLGCVEAAYETTACIMQYRIKLKPGETKEINLLFGPANNKEEIKRMKDKYLQKGSFDRVVSQYDHFYHENSGCIQIATKDETLNHFINYWLPRQILYHAYSLRMVTDPQTRNHIQDAMGMVYVMPEKAKQLYNIALKQQKISGEMPDGILLVEGAEFKYTNQIPHRDHSVWWTYAVSEYMEESGDYGYLEEKLGFSDSDEILSVYEHVCRGIEWLIYDRTEGGFCHIGQGDWNDPMNMVGHKGKGESIWLTQAMTYAMRIWLPFCEEKGDGARVEKFSKIMKETNELLNTEAWDGRWYSRGVTDDGNKMGVSTDEEGQIFLNAQSFGILTGAVDRERMETIIKAVDEKLGTPFGLELLAPSYTHMREDVGRITLKHPGTAENGSVYCHANTFYTYALLEYGYGQRAYEILRSLIPGPDGEDLKKREHLPLYLPNYYRGDHNPRTAGKASHLMNTGSLPWFYRSFIEGIFGLKGCKEGLRIEPQLPKEYDRMTLVRRFRGKILNVEYVRKENTGGIKIILNGAERADNLLPEDELKHVNTLQIQLPL